VTAVVLDAEALSLLARGGSGEATVRASLAAAVELGADVAVPAAVLAELYRGGAHDQAIDACLAREGGVDVVSTDRSLARRVGHLLAAAGRDSADHVDATVVAAAIAHGGGVVVTGDPNDLEVLADGLASISIRGVRPTPSRSRPSSPRPSRRRG